MHIKWVCFWEKWGFDNDMDCVSHIPSAKKNRFSETCNLTIWQVSISQRQDCGPENS